MWQVPFIRQAFRFDKEGKLVGEGDMTEEDLVRLARSLRREEVAVIVTQYVCAGYPVRVPDPRTMTQPEQVDWSFLIVAPGIYAPNFSLMDRTTAEPLPRIFDPIGLRHARWEEEAVRLLPPQER